VAAAAACVEGASLQVEETGGHEMELFALETAE
jgi:hypothetical protein